jgi:hypothetical protein
MVYFELGLAQTPCPTGTVQFMVDGNLASTVTLPGSNCGTSVEFKTATLAAGSTHNVTAVYSGDTLYAGATSGQVNHTVVADATTVTLSSNGQSVNVGQPVTFTAVVTPALEDASAQPPSGNVLFLDSGVQIGTGALTSSAPYTATFTMTLSAGAHSITASYVNSDGLYAGNSSSVTAETVNQIAPNVTWPNPSDFVYGTKLDSTQQNATATDGNGNTIDGTFTYNPVAGTVLPVGTRNMTVTFTPTDTATYTTQTASVTVNVTAAPLTVTANGASRVYGTDNPTFGYSINGFVNNDTAGTATTGTPAESSTAVALNPVGSYDITAAVGTFAAPNYAVTYVPGKLTVTAAALTVQADSFARAYGASNLTLTGSSSGLVTGDDISASFSTTATQTSPVNSYQIIATLNDPNGRLTNYTVTNTAVC